MRKLTLLLMLLGLAMPLAAQAPADMLLRPGDVLRITVLRHPELSGEFAINANGTLMHPTYRDLLAAGVPLADLEDSVRALLARFESRPEFVLDPLFQVAVGGEVRQPSLYALRPTTTIAQAVAMAGGATERGRLDRVRLFRGGTEYKIDLSRPEGGKGMDLIRSGDQILVERRSSVFREVIAPAGSIVGALAALVNILTR
ncbi:MAG TPA: SLBB domain-containing protein [Longimicrobiales bacterium]|nr:SLBB domain-containing protein [Longimicrobiales bacterium]